MLEIDQSGIAIGGTLGGSQGASTVGECLVSSERKSFKAESDRCKETGERDSARPAFTYPAKMPTYDYACKKCGHEFEFFQSMNDERLTKCPQKGCRGKVERLLGTGAGIIFKGDGFYETEYRSESYKAGEKKAGETSSKKSESEAAKKESKPKKKPAKKKASEQ